MDKLDTLRQKYIPNEKKTSDSSIIDTITHYDSDEISNFINKLNKETTEQRVINGILKDKDYETNINLIEEFMETEGDIIDNQLSEINNLKNDIIKLVQENKKLKLNEYNYQSISNSSKANKIIHQLDSIRKTRDEIKHFLESNNIPF